MSRLIFVPQYPAKMRYQETWYDEFPKEMKKYFDEVVVLGETFININRLNEKMSRSANHMFSPIQFAIHMEMDQINEYYIMKTYDDDYLFLSDLSFPGFFTNILYHKPLKNAYCYCHATSRNYLDYFQPVTYSKFDCETGHSKLFKKVFIGSSYHYHKLKWENTHVVGLPIPPYQTYNERKIYDVISVARENDQKIDKNLEKIVEEKFGKIVRKEVNTWEEYYKFLSQGKVLLITSKEDTFNYSIMEAVMNNTIPIAPNRLAFPELLTDDYLYNDHLELIIELNEALHNQLETPTKLLCHDKCEKFYENIAKEMLKG